MSKNKQPQAPLDEPDPNADREAGYPNLWNIEHNKQTAKCNFCNHRLAGTKWCIACDKCRRRMCSSCWTGDRYNRYGEQIFEGSVQNKEGCWCRFPTKTNPAYKRQIDERSARMQTMIADGFKPETKTGDEEPPVKRRRIEQDADPEDEEPAEAHQKTSQAPGAPFLGTNANKHFHETTTVVVGAGVVGLFIARELAATLQNERVTSHKVIVVEQQEWYGEGASAHCAGLLTKHGVPKEYGPLLDLSLERWHSSELLQRPKVKEYIRYVPDGVMHVKAKMVHDGSTKGPSWYKSRTADTFRKNPNDVGKISTPHLLRWLHEECKRFHVEFRFRQEISNVYKKKGKIYEVEVRRVDNHDRNATIPCHNIIVAAGAKTPTALDLMTGWIPLPDEPENKERFDWARFKDISFKADCGMMIRRDDGTYTSLFAPQRDATEMLVATVGASKAERLAAHRINGIAEAKSYNSGETTVITSFNNLPLVDKLPWKVVDPRHKRYVDRLGIYIAYGFGKFGTTLAPGAATAVCRMIMGQDAGIGESFKYPRAD